MILIPLITVLGLFNRSADRQVLPPQSVAATSPMVVCSPYNWVRESGYIQTANPGAYAKVGFTGSQISINVDVSPFIKAQISENQYPLVRVQVDGNPAKTLQLNPTSQAILCAQGLLKGKHTLLVQYVAGYVFLDFWTPINVLRITSFGLDKGAKLTHPLSKLKRSLLFLGDSITNGDDDLANFTDGITNAVQTQDATLGYSGVIAKSLGAEYGIVAYGGASWDGTAADGHTPGLMTFYDSTDKDHKRFFRGKLSPVPDEIFINMGENMGPTGDDVPKLLTALRAASSPRTKIFVIIPFSGRARETLGAGFGRYRESAKTDSRTYLLDTGNEPQLTDAGRTEQSVDGQHPLVILHQKLGQRLLKARELAITSGSSQSH